MKEKSKLSKYCDVGAKNVVDLLVGACIEESDTLQEAKNLALSIKSETAYKPSHSIVDDVVSEINKIALAKKC